MRWRGESSLISSAVRCGVWDENGSSFSRLARRETGANLSPVLGVLAPPLVKSSFSIRSQHSSNGVPERGVTGAEAAAADLPDERVKEANRFLSESGVAAFEGVVEPSLDVEALLSGVALDWLAAHVALRLKGGVFGSEELMEEEEDSIEGGILGRLESLRRSC